MLSGDDKEEIKLTRIDWDSLNNKIDDGNVALYKTISDMSEKLDKIFTKLFGDPSCGEDGMYEEHKKMWDAYKEGKWWRNRTTAIISTAGGVLGVLGMIISLILNARRL